MINDSFIHHRGVRTRRKESRVVGTNKVREYKDNEAAVALRPRREGKKWRRLGIIQK